MTTTENPTRCPYVAPDDLTPFASQIADIIHSIVPDAVIGVGPSFITGSGKVMMIREGIGSRSWVMYDLWDGQWHDSMMGCGCFQETLWTLIARLNMTHNYKVVSKGKLDAMFASKKEIKGNFILP